MEQGEGCKFNADARKIGTYEQLAAFGLSVAFDLEELVVLGKKVRACPYYAARSLMETADLIFCPYNYLVDPLIRDSLQIRLKDQIIILDEAHNMEDSARESASCSIELENLIEARNDLEQMARDGQNIFQCERLAWMISLICVWMESYSDRLEDYKEFDRSGKIFTGVEMVAHLNEMGLNEEKLKELQDYFKELTADLDPEDDTRHLKGLSSMLLKSFFLMHYYLSSGGGRHMNDFRVALVKSQNRWKNWKAKQEESVWLNRGRPSLSWNMSINFWCLNPAVAFSKLKDDSRCIILTSGTLSPMTSFESELGVDFHHKLEANHVISKEQIWVGTLNNGPFQRPLMATYKNTESYEFQDELGRVAINICRSVANGVLFFLPSYSLLTKLVERWQSTNIWSELSKTKVVIFESRDASEFEETMKSFYEVIQRTKFATDLDQVNGSFLMAVCRGKVSEGLDFTDENARAVVVVGIPFPSIKDIQVDLKRKYNDVHRSKGLLNGNDWYEIQAFRAVNQALGRCIRHRYDWGALILIDSRYQYSHERYTKGLSRWVRNNIVHYSSFNDAIVNLRQFATRMLNNPPKPPDSAIELPTTDITTSNEEKSCDSSFSVSSTANELIIRDPPKMPFEREKDENGSPTSSATTDVVAKCKILLTTPANIRYSKVTPSHKLYEMKEHFRKIGNILKEDRKNRKPRKPRNRKDKNESILSRSFQQFFTGDQVSTKKSSSISFLSPDLNESHDLPQNVPDIKLFRNITSPLLFVPEGEVQHPNNRGKKRTVNINLAKTCNENILMLNETPSKTRCEVKNSQVEDLDDFNLNTSYRKTPLKVNLKTKKKGVQFTDFESNH